MGTSIWGTWVHSRLSIQTPDFGSGDLVCEIKPLIGLPAVHGACLRFSPPLPMPLLMLTHSHKKKRQKKVCMSIKVCVYMQII